MGADVVAGALGCLVLGAFVTPQLPPAMHGLGWWVVVSLVGIPLFLMLCPLLIGFLFISGVMTK